LAKNINNKKRFIIFLAVLLAGVISGTAAFSFYYGNNDNGTGENIISNYVPDTKLNDRVSFLLIGADKRPGEDGFNADSLIVASVDPDTNLISMLSIPRDTRVTLKGSTGFVKINSVPMLRGIPELKEQVSDLTGITLDGYVLTNFQGFKDIIDTLGGITIDVEKDMKFETGDKVDGYINLKAGEQLLDGSKALQYARYRDNTSADIGRTARQQKVLTTVAKKILQPGTITKLPKLVPQFFEAVETDLKLADLLRLSQAAVNFESATIVTQTLPGIGLYLDHLSYWEVNRTTAKQVAQNLLLGITTDEIIDNSVLDLLDPEIKKHITIPGSSQDPNGKKSTGYQEELSNDMPKEELPDDTAKEESPATDSLSKPEIEIVVP